MRFSNMKISILWLGSLVFISSACTKPKEAPQEAVMTEEGDEDAADLGSDDMSMDEDLADEGDLNEGTVPEASVQPAPATTEDSSQRVVRYIMTDNTPAYSQADEKSQQVGNYLAGDAVVVKINGDWAEITDNYFVRASSLSTKIVPRKRSDGWAPQMPTKVSAR